MWLRGDRRSAHSLPGGAGSRESKKIDDRLWLNRGGRRVRRQAKHRTFPCVAQTAARRRQASATSPACVARTGARGQQAAGRVNQLLWELERSSPVALSVHYGDNYQSVLLNDPGFLLRVEDTVYLVFCGRVDNLDSLQTFLGLHLQ